MDRIAGHERGGAAFSTGAQVREVQNGRRAGDLLESPGVAFGRSFKVLLSDRQRLALFHPAAGHSVTESAARCRALSMAASGSRKFSERRLNNTAQLKPS